jgi:restriction endonuclease S subunit
VNIKSYKESFGVTGRLDAEYYQKKYDDYLSLIYNYNNGFQKLASACNLKDNNYNPSENTLYKYIELSNIGKSGEVNGCTEELGKDLPSRARRIVNTGDVVISSIEGSLQSCAVISKEYDNALCSTGFYVIKSDKINSETLLVLFKSEPMQAIMKQNCSGTILTAMNKDEFLNIPIPLIDPKKQKQIAALIEESFQLKTESERLLEVAKKAVEMAIEQNEKAALDYIDSFGVK